MEENRNAYIKLVVKPEGKRPLGSNNVGAWIILKLILE
jgi:hypothetical protein